MAGKVTHIIRPDDRFGRGTVIREVRMPGNGKYKTMRGVRLLCDCGTIYETRLSYLVRAVRPTQSCGCLRRERVTAYAQSEEGRAKLALNMRRVAAEARANGTAYSGTHRLSHGRHPLYNTWCNMMTRCYNLEYSGRDNYGGRGITVCERWHDPVLFIQDIEQLIGLPLPGMTLDRTNNNRGYEPGNMRWATRAEQNQNSRLRRDAKLDAGKVLDIKQRLAAGESGRSIARFYCVSTSTVSLIKTGKAWRSVQLPS